MLKPRGEAIGPEWGLGDPSEQAPEIEFRNGRPLLRMFNQGGHDCTECDLLALLDFMRAMPPLAAYVGAGGPRAALAEKGQRALVYLCSQPVDSVLYEYGRDLLDWFNELDAELIRARRSGG